MCCRCGGQGSPPSNVAPRQLTQALLLTAAQPAQGVGQSGLQQLDLVLLQLQLLLQVGHPVLHVQVTARRHRVIWTGGERGSFRFHLQRLAATRQPAMGPDWQEW